MVLAALALSATVSAQTAPAAPMPKEVAALQGVWDVTLFNDQPADSGAIALEFKDLTYAVYINGGVDETGTFALDTSKTPWTFDLSIKEGNDAGKLQLGILEMKGEAIHGLLGTPGDTTRPASFDAPSGAVGFVALKRKK
jgi:uncharacterized protein (TIGR03067 family)